MPVSGTVDFTSIRVGWLLGTDGTVANTTTGLYRTTDGGRAWQLANICRPGSRPAVTCGAPRFFGPNGAVPAVALNPSTGVGQPLVYTTTDAGRTWSRHTLVVDPALQRHLAPLFSAPDANDLFVDFAGGALGNSSDGGKHWSRLPAPSPAGGSGAELDFISRNDGWIMVGGQLDSTTDGGQHWAPIGAR